MCLTTEHNTLEQMKYLGCIVSLILSLRGNDVPLCQTYEDANDVQQGTLLERCEMSFNPSEVLQILGELMKI